MIMKKTSKLNLSQRAIVGHGPTSQQLRAMSELPTTSVSGFAFFPETSTTFCHEIRLKFQERLAWLQIKCPSLSLLPVTFALVQTLGLKLDAKYEVLGQNFQCDCLSLALTTFTTDENTGNTQKTF